MKMKLLGLIAAFMGALFGSSCRAGYDHCAETKVGGITIRVGLERSHPWLAEYRKFLEIEQAGVLRRKEIFQDSGGYAWVTLFDDHGRFEVRDLDDVQFTATLNHHAATRKYLGRFDFDLRRTYRFIPASEDAREPKVSP
ncbi:MAG: hypothetical protein KF715_07700 [Candidatus Didemnitutus sp.]|nr:hypothetical protein [Candidatus Didemnitutus sp.]